MNLLVPLSVKCLFPTAQPFVPTFIIKIIFMVTDEIFIKDSLFVLTIIIRTNSN